MLGPVKKPFDMIVDGLCGGQVGKECTGKVGRCRCLGSDGCAQAESDWGRR